MRRPPWFKPAFTALAFVFGLVLASCHGRVIDTHITSHWETDPEPTREVVLESRTTEERSRQIGFSDALDVDLVSRQVRLNVTTDTIRTTLRTDVVESTHECHERELGSRTIKSLQTPNECAGAILLGTLGVVGTAGLLALISLAETASDTQPPDDGDTFPCSGFSGGAAAGGGSGGGKKKSGPCARHEWNERVDRIVDTREEVSTSERVVRVADEIETSVPTDGGWFSVSGEIIPEGSQMVVSREGELAVEIQPSFPLAVAPSRALVADALDLSWLDESCRLTAAFHIVNHVAEGETTVVVEGDAPDEQGRLTTHGSKTYTVSVWMAPPRAEVLELCP